jgi:hypothetical protein
MNKENVTIHPPPQEYYSTLKEKGISVIRNNVDETGGYYIK